MSVEQRRGDRRSHAADQPGRDRAEGDRYLAVEPDHGARLFRHFLDRAGRRHAPTFPSPAACRFRTSSMRSTPRPRRPMSRRRSSRYRAALRNGAVGHQGRGRHQLFQQRSGDDILNKLGVTDSSGAFTDVLQTSQSANFTLDGIEMTRDTNDITDVLERRDLQPAAGDAERNHAQYQHRDRHQPDHDRAGDVRDRLQRLSRLGHRPAGDQLGRHGDRRAPCCSATAPCATSSTGWKRR